MSPRVAKAVLAAFLLLPAAGPTAAQRGIELSLTPQVGLITPVEWFYYEITVLGEGPMEWTEAAVLRSTVLGATAEMDFSRLGLSIQGTLLRTLDASTVVRFAVMNAGPFDPPYVERSPYRVSTDILLASIDLALATRLHLPMGVQPYFVAGIGSKHYRFDRSALSEADPGIVAPEDGATAMLGLGAGVVVPLSPVLALNLQVRDTVSEYWEAQQHDVVWIMGLRWSALRL